MGVQPTLPIKVSVTIGTMLNFDGDFDGHGDSDITAMTQILLKFVTWYNRSLQHSCLCKQLG